MTFLINIKDVHPVLGTVIFDKLQTDEQNRFFFVILPIFDGMGKIASIRLDWKLYKEEGNEVLGIVNVDGAGDRVVGNLR